MKMIEDFKNMVEKSLNLREPWYVKGAEFHADEPAIHIYIGVTKRAVIACPKCGGATKRYGYEPRERVWRHGDCMFYPTFIHCRRPKVLCPSCGVQQVNAPFERQDSRFTLMYEGYAMLIMASMPIAKAARALRCDEKTLTNILNYWVEKAVDERKLCDIKSIAIDETSFRKGHDYVTVVIDAAKRAVIDVEPGKDASTVEKFSEKLTQKGGNCAEIKSVTSDMSAAFLSAVEEKFPNAKHTIDKFHVKQLVLKSLDEVRKKEQKESSEKQALFRGRKLFMIPEKRLTEEQRIALQSLSKQYPKTGRAYRIVSVLDDFYACETAEDADPVFAGLYSWMRRSRLPEMKNTAATLLKHKDRIMNYFDNRLTNAICEGINSMIQSAKRAARGFHTFKGFASKIFLVAGKLNLAVSCPF